jgi:hypothetical protein
VLLSPDLLPERADEVRIRLRFYDLSFTVLHPSHMQPLAPTTGRFREAAVGSPARWQELVGETSMFLWADSETYVMWAREAFGWPVLRGQIELTGSLWSADELLGASGSARVTDAWGSAFVQDAIVHSSAGSGSPAARWLTPRRLLRQGGLDGEIRELLMVSPTPLAVGARYKGTARASFTFDKRHPLARIPEAEAELDIADGFEIVVGENVDVLA